MKHKECFSVQMLYMMLLNRWKFQSLSKPDKINKENKIEILSDVHTILYRKKLPQSLRRITSLQSSSRQFSSEPILFLPKETTFSVPSPTNIARRLRKYSQ